MKNGRIGAEEYERLSADAAREIDPDIDERAMSMVFNLVRASNQIIKRLESRVLRDADMNFSSYGVLFSLRAVGETNPNELARLSGVSTASMSSLLNTMSRKQLITRRPDPDDGRRTLVQLTGKGEELLAELIVLVNGQEREWADRLSVEEGSILVLLLRRMLSHRSATNQTDESETPNE